jgi:hypothetical protein
LRTKATRKTPQSLRYLLWVDNKLQRISLKKVALPLGRARTGKPARAARARKSPRSAGPKEFQSAITSPASLVAIVVLSGAAILGMMGRARGPEAGVTAADLPLPAAAAVEAPAIETPSTAPVVEPAPAKPTPPAEPRNVTAAAAAAPPPAPPAPPAPEPGSTPAEEVAPPAVTAAAAALPAAATTVSGCLTVDDGNYRLKDVTGADAPKSRSWKSGFLTRRSATIAVRDADHSLGLANYVWKRVAATGTLAERELQVRSLERLADSCRQ